MCAWWCVNIASTNYYNQHSCNTRSMRKLTLLILTPTNTGHAKIPLPNILPLYKRQNNSKPHNLMSRHSIQYWVVSRSNWIWISITCLVFHLRTALEMQTVNCIIGQTYQQERMQIFRDPDHKLCSAKSVVCIFVYIAERCITLSKI